MLETAWLIPLFPLAGVLVNALLGRWLGRRVVAAIANLAVAASFVAALVVLVELLGLDPESRSHVVPLYRWIVAGDFEVEARLLIDPLSIVMALVVTGVSALIHVYSAAYMHGEHYYERYFTWLNLFVLMMLILVLGDSFVTLYVGWEGVGLSSYLLIGYWFQREAPAAAARKAFLVNRVGDLGFALGIMLIFATFGSVMYDDVLPAALAGLTTPGTATAIALLLLAGAVAKSAQFPLHVWLPDAMEGPTPVSALIHAATMVTAGVYMIARCHPLFEASTSALNWVLWIGGITAFFAATVALVQRDLKRILAYSTISQLGYMFLALGAGAYGAAIFHLMTHAFFKALLFLCAGAVMHALDGELDIFKMGGLRHKLRWTFVTTLVGVLALAGVPLFSGFFSKEAILAGVYAQAGVVPWLLGTVTAGITAFYAFRLLFVVFYGRARGERRRAEEAHDPAVVMLVPLIGLAVLAVVGGYLGLPHVVGVGSAIEEFLEPVFAGTILAGEAVESVALEWLMIGAAVVAVAAGAGLAYWLYLAREELAARWTREAKWLHDLLFNAYYVDRVYTEVIVNPLRAAGSALSGTVEVMGVDRAVDGLAELVGMLGGGVQRLQTGLVRNYAVGMLIGVVALLGYFLVRALIGG
ncbi:MAG: NADH-quinone oxidoreductase subunit L [Anaerolineae bacterium]|nr:NADH-quinone oxidoreductase subunit L [Anaerolineae bacterium]